MSATQTFFGDLFIDHEEKEYDAGSIEHKKLLGLFFSAHWCPPCRNFTPVLKEFYEAIKKQYPHDFEVVFLSFDQSLEQFREYYKDMPWKAFPFGDARIKAFCSKFDVKDIPTLIILRPDGTLVSSEGRHEVTVHGTEACNKWKFAK